jgi:fructose-bisphosphate aldolase, class II
MIVRRRSHDQLLTDPQQPADFVKRTGVDALAIAIGTSHGAYKFSRKPTGDILAIDRIKEIHARMPKYPPCHARVVIGAPGMVGDHPAGRQQNQRDLCVRVAEIQEGIKHGVRKVNIDTDIRRAMTAAVRRLMVKNPEEFDPRKFLAEATKAVTDICQQRFEAFGSAVL